MSADGVLRAWWEGLDLAGLSDAELSSLGRDLARCRNSLAGMVTQLAREATAREATGAAPPADETLTGRGERSFDEADRAKDRAGVSDQLPASGAGVDDGTATEANADALGRLVARLTASELARLKRYDRAIRARMGDRPELFARWLAALAHRIADSPDGGDGLSAAERAKAEAGVWLRRRGDGTWELRGRFDPERGTELDRAINAYARDIAGSGGGDGGGSVTANDRAAALHALVMQHGDGLGRRTIGIGYIVDLGAETTVDWAGDPVEPAVAARHGCDADVWVSFHDRAGHPSRVGRARRAATREQRLQLRGLYPTCPIDGVTPFARCEVHHLIPFEHGGETELYNLVPISSAWHHRFHDRGWTLTMAEDRSLRILRPNGDHHRTIPAPARPPP